MRLELRHVNRRAITVMLGVASLTVASPFAYASTAAGAPTSAPTLRAQAAQLTATSPLAAACGTTRFQTCATTTDHFDVTDTGGAYAGRSTSP